MQAKQESTTRPASDSASTRIPASARGSAGSAPTSTRNPAPAATGSGPATGRERLKPGESAFSALFLERASRREAGAAFEKLPGEGLSDTRLARLARWRGPWEVERVPAGRGWLHGVTRRAEPAREGGGARLACLRRQDALLGAAAFAALAAPNHLSVNVAQPSGRRSGLGFPLHDGREHIGHLGRAARGTERDFLAAYHALRCLAANPDAAALFLEALDPETLAILGRAALRRLG